MSKDIRIGLVSTNWWADMMLLPAMLSHPHTEVVAICGRDQVRAEEIAIKYRISRVFVDYREMIKHADLTALIIAAPDDLHYEIAIEALSSGLHVFCEKPLAMNAQQAREMYKTAQRAGVIHMVHFTYRWMPFFQYLHDLIDQGYIGRCYHGEFRYLQDYGRNSEYQWRFDRKRANGVLGDLGTHVIDLARWMVGDIREVRAQLGVFVEREGLEGGRIDPANDSAQLLIQFANGAHGFIQASAVAHMADRGWQQQINLYGEAGSLELRVPFWGADAGAILRVSRSSDEQFQRLEVPDVYWGGVDRSDPFGIFTQQSVGCRLFVDAITENRLVSPTFYDGYKAQQVVDAALESHRSGCAQTIDDAD